MKWFQHQCTARNDAKLQMLGSSHGAEGIGIYWGLLEEIGQQSDTFHLKILGESRDADELFSDYLRYPLAVPENPFGDCDIIRSIPRLTATILAKNLFTRPKKLRAVIAYCVEVGLFDARKWLEFNVLYSPSFERRAEGYTRRLKGTSNNVRTNSEHCSDNVRTEYEQCTNIVRILSEVSSDNVRLDTETEREEEEEKKKNTNKTNEEMPVKNVDNSRLAGKTSEKADFSIRGMPKSDERYLIELKNEVFDEYAVRFHSIIQTWNREYTTHAVHWRPTTAELGKLFYGGEYGFKLSMCFHAYKLLGETINYPELVLRSLRLFLATNARAKIDNPFGWIWSCLHGNGNGTKPWVQLMTSEEENTASKPGQGSPLRPFGPRG